MPLLNISNRVDHDYVLESAKQLKAANLVLKAEKSNSAYFGGVAVSTA